LLAQADDLGLELRCERAAAPGLLPHALHDRTSFRGQTPDDGCPSKRVRPNPVTNLIHSVPGHAKRDILPLDLTGAVLTGAVLTGAVLTGADLRAAMLGGAYLTGAVLGRAVLADAVLGCANLIRAYLTGAVLDRADLSGAVLSGADLDDPILTDARWPEGVRVPVGWTVDGDSGRLKRAGGLSEVTVGFDLLSGG
jgi:Pentapeptide repeats (8 copies)